MSGRVTLSPGGVTVDTSDLRKSFGWRWLRVDADRRAIRIHHGPAGAIVLPRSSFASPEAAEHFLAAARAHAAAGGGELPVMRLEGPVEQAVEYELSEQDHADGAYRSTRAQWVDLATWTFGGGVVVGLLGVPLFLVQGDRGEAAVAALVIVVSVAILGWARTARSRTARAVAAARRDWPAHGLRHRLAFGPGGVEYASAVGTSVMRWSRIPRIEEDARRLYVFEPGGVTIVPKAAMSDPRGFVSGVRRLRAAARGQGASAAGG